MLGDTRARIRNYADKRKSNQVDSIPDSQAVSQAVNQPAAGSEPRASRARASGGRIGWPMRCWLCSIASSLSATSQLLLRQRYIFLGFPTCQYMCLAVTSP